MPDLLPKRFALPVICLVACLFIAVGTILPRETAMLFASPDETAVALFARGWTLEQGFRLPTNVPEAIALIPGLHPRSQVQQGAWLVPVGFLGMPIIALPFEKLWQGSAAFVMALLVISSAWPLWQFARQMGSPRAAAVAVTVYLTFPTVLLYTNRGLFPNLPVVALGLWSVWLLGQKRGWKAVLGGVLLGVALAIRPLEGAWLLPWVVWGFMRGRTIKSVVKNRLTAYMFLALLLFPAVAYLASVHTYQSVRPTIGYWLRDTAPTESPTVATPEQAAAVPTLLPFGIHPRTMEANIRTFWLAMLWPWVALAFAGLVQVWWRGHHVLRSPILWLAVWTGGILHLFYGQAIYIDNIRGAPAIGNSFLRYMLPLVPLIALAIGAWAEAVARSLYRKIAVGLVIIALGGFGLWMGLAADEEGILNTQKELRRYTEIRQEAARTLLPGTIVMSERSDKIFAGLPGIVVVSPLPANGEMGYALAHNIPVALFHRELTPEQQRAIGIEFTEQFRHDNERMYQLHLSTDSE